MNWIAADTPSGFAVVPTTLEMFAERDGKVRTAAMRVGLACWRKGMDVEQAVQATLNSKWIAEIIAWNRYLAERTVREVYKVNWAS